METPIEVLRIEQNVVSKELGRFRACDPISRSFYCREWAQYIYKKHFVWNAKTQEDMQEQQQQHHGSALLGAGGGGVMSTGHYTICMLQPPCEAKRKERSPKLSEQFEKLLEAKSTCDEEDDDDDDDDGDDSTPGGKKQSGSTASPSSPTLTQDIIQACILWQSLPSSLSGLPSIFEPVQFNPFPDHIPLDDDLKAPAQLLDPLIIERQALCLPSDGFHLLKNLTGDILISHTQPSCLHTKPDDPSPADLELDRQMLNDDLQTITLQVLAAMDKRLMVSWQPLLDFLRQLTHLEEQRNKLMGQQCQATVDAFVEKQQLGGSFSTVWQQQQGSMADAVKMVDTYLDDLIKHVQNFLNDFVNPRLEQIGQLIQDLWDLVGPTIQHMAERMATHEERDKGNAENCKAVSQSLKGLHSTKEVDEAIDRIQHAMADRVDDYITSVQDLKKTYSDLGGGGLKAQMDKIQHKDFRKRVKRLEAGYTSLRQFFRYEVTQKIFPETLFCKFSLVCLGALMQEGEVMEAMIIETEVKRFIESHRPLVKRRQSIVVQYEEGVQAGRRELAGILGKLFLKEGMRIQGENLALKRQAMLLKSMGVDEGGSGGSSNQPNPGGGGGGGGGANGGGGSGSNSNNNNSSSVNQGKSESGSKKKKKNKKKKAATAQAAATASTLPIETEDNNDTSSTTTALDNEAVVEPATAVSSPSIRSTTLTAQPPPDEPKIASSPVQQPIKKNKVLTIPPSPASTYVPPPPIETTAPPTQPPSSNKSSTSSSKSTLGTTHKAKSSPKQSSNSKITAPVPAPAPATSSQPSSTPTSKKNDNIPGAPASTATPTGNKAIRSTKKPSSPPSSSSSSTTTTTTTGPVSAPSISSTAPVDPPHPPPSLSSPGPSPAAADTPTSPAPPDQSMADLVQQLQQDRLDIESKMKALQQDMTTMQQHYREQQQQTWQWYEQQQAERKEMQRYIQQLEQQVKHYQQQQVGPVGTLCSTTTSSSSSPLDHHWLTAGFGNQDLFAGYRQEMQSYQQPPPF
ncbi:hypothetical protein [Absidia glauca]|uniref:Uncharacterized protein n=1 Tax=Absidia glauca TaxID=4829 RepID=A0A163KUA3_ABSGL|nr:hypothetical protein [Absidia glauca]